MFKYIVFISLFINSVILTAQNTQEPVVVFELFTSQGCSSCPPADRLLEEIKTKHANENVFVLSFHVDYWNRLGWRDPFSAASYSAYQGKYADQFNSRNVYTPQLVANGSEHYTGSDASRVNQSLSKYGGIKSTSTIDVSNIQKTSGNITFDYNIFGSDVANTSFALVIAERITKVSRGENSNRTLENHNIVANFSNKTNKSGSVTMTIPSWIKSTDNISLISYTKNDSYQVNGANSFPL